MTNKMQKNIVYHTS